MLTIRLQRAGKTNRPDFRIVLAEKTAAASKKFIEVLGHYNPRTKDFGVKEDRLKYWMSQQVSLSPTIHNLFITQKLMEGTKIKSFTIPPKAKEEEKPAASEAVTSEAPTENAVEEATETPADETAQTETKTEEQAA